jgi:catechol 2,3-dioxygenase-like lactoylglutathione lyase family enzyme
MAFITFLLAAAAPPARKIPPRPQISGIAYVRIHSTSQLSVPFFKNVLGFGGIWHCKDRSLVCIPVNERQLIQLDLAETRLPHNFVEEVGFVTSDVSAMRKYLLVMGLKPGRVETKEESPTSVYSSRVTITDPEGHGIAFVQGRVGAYYLDYDPRASRDIIHAGLVVRDRAAADHFYKDILGFRPYWHGGMKDDQTDWVSLQVPDGTDWLEFMVNVPSDADKRLLGIMNHIALGVPDIHTAEAQLHKNGWTGTEEPKIGRGGKWQLNLYDPDDTRIELMEFTPVQKPCCSEYTGPHPKP